MYFYNFDFQISFSGNFRYATGLFYSKLVILVILDREKKIVFMSFFALQINCADGRVKLFLRTAKIEK